jgi:hypothetical protein
MPPTAEDTVTFYPVDDVRVLLSVMKGFVASSGELVPRRLMKKESVNYVFILLLI